MNPTRHTLHMFGNIPEPDAVAEHLRTYLNKHQITRADIEAEYLSKARPTVSISYVYLAGSGHSQHQPYTDEVLKTLFIAGKTISDFIDAELSQDHPTDKRFLLRYMELLCTRYELNQFKSTGFGHDVIFSKTPLDDHYPKFDNSLYVPPLTGHWAIAAKGAARD